MPHTALASPLLFCSSVYVIKKCEERKMPAVLKAGANVDKVMLVTKYFSI